MAFKDFPKHERGLQLLQRSLERGRLGHAYLFTGQQLDELETLARALAKTLNCQRPVKRSGVAVDCCDRCLSCRKIEHDNHADVLWVRPESKSRQIRIGQLVRREDSPGRVLLEMVSLKPTESEHKVAIIVAADRMNEQAANAFLKTLEEPPARSVLILLTTEPQRLLETIVSRCLRLNFGGGDGAAATPEQLNWLQSFAEMAGAEHKSLLARYRLVDALLRKLAEMRAAIEANLTARSPLERYPDVEKELRDKWEDELAAAIEAEYRRQRAELLSVVQWWLRDVWLGTLEGKALAGLLWFPQLAGTRRVAARLSSRQALQNLQSLELLQRWLGTNVQEALALEVGFLKLQI